MHLKNGAALQGGKYRIVKVLGTGTFGVTYLAKTKVSGNFGTIETSVAIKEFFSSELNTRLEDGSVREMSDSSLASKYLKKFADEAGKISLLKDHPGIVNVLETFSENNTCYYVMEYKDGGSLREYIDSKGGVSETEGIEIIKKIADALSYMHSHKMLHLDLKPGNVMMDSDGSLCLIDFGLSRHFENEESESTTGIGLGTVGYAPIEQAGYNSADARKDIPVTIDIYALGATFYKILTGKTPPPSYELLQSFPDAALKAKGVSSMTIEAIKRAMAPIPSSRPQTVEEFLSLLDDDNLDSEPLSKSETIKGEPCVIDKTQVVPEKEEPKKESSVQEENTEPKTKSRKWIWWLLIILLAAGLSLLLFRNNPSSSTDDLSEPTGMHEGYGYVDLGLSVRWATHNLGASDAWDCGDLYAWGETSVKDNTSRNCRTYGHDYGGSGSEGARNPVWSYCGVPEYDAATTNWGGDWRMPTHEDFQELIDNCTWKWTTINGREGYMVTSKKNGNSIFLPAADNSDQSSEDARVGYWTASDVGGADIEFAQFLCISPDTYSLEWEDRFAGLNVRPVLPALAQRNGYNGGCVDRIELNKYYRLMHEGLKYEDEGRLEDAYKNFQSALEIENEWDSAEDYFLFDLDAAKALNRVVDQVYKGRHNGYEWVDLGLSVKWATCNIGASTPGDYGNYYAWGETKSSYDYDNCASYGKSWSDIGGNSSRDAARANLGGSWRMPTKSELEELQDNCTWTWTKQNGHKGYKVTSKKNGQSIFLPAAGHPKGDTFVNLGKNGYYWSSTPDTPGTLNACQLRLDIEGHKVVGSSRSYRFSVRPVLDCNIF